MNRKPTELEKALGDALAAECLAIFGSTWSNDVRWRLAKAALRHLEERTTP